MNSPENEIREFFTEMKTEDSRLAPPPFPGLPQRKIRRKTRMRLPLLAVASVLLLFVCYWLLIPAQPPASSPQVLVISGESQNTNSTESLLAHPDPLLSWESPSASLIADF